MFDIVIEVFEKVSKSGRIDQIVSLGKGFATVEEEEAQLCRSTYGITFRETLDELLIIGELLEEESEDHCLELEVSVLLDELLFGGQLITQAFQLFLLFLFVVIDAR